MEYKEENLASYFLFEFFSTASLWIMYCGVLLGSLSMAYFIGGNDVIAFSNISNESYFLKSSGLIEAVMQENRLIKSGDFNLSALNVPWLSPRSQCLL